MKEDIDKVSGQTEEIGTLEFKGEKKSEEPVKRAEGGVEGRDYGKIERALSNVRRKKENLTPALQAIQEEIGYIPQRSFEQLSDIFNVSKSKIYGIASFYSQFRLKPPGEYTIKVCEGTACHLKGGEEVLESLKKKLGIEVYEVTEDDKFTLTTVRCLGCCSLAPVMMVGDEVHGNLTGEKARKIIEEYM